MFRSYKEYKRFILYKIMKFKFNFQRDKKYIITTLLIGSSLIYIHRYYAMIVDFVCLLTYEQ